MRKFFDSLLRIKFVRDIATLQVGTVVGTVCGLLSSILFARLLGLGGYGEYAIILAFTGIFHFFTNLGQQTTTLTFLSEAYGKKSKEEITKVLHYYVFVSCLTIFLLGILIVISPMLTQWIYQSKEYGILAQIVFLSAMIDPLFVLMTVVLQVVREIRILTIIENARITLQLGLAVAFLLLGYGVAGILWSSMIGTALFALIALSFYPRIRRSYDLPKLIDVLRVKGYKHLWKYGRDGIWIALNKNIANLYPTIFLFMLSTQVRESVVGLIRMGFQLGQLPTSLVLSNISRMASSVIPTLAGKGVSIRKALLRLGRYSGMIHISVSICGLLIIPPLIPYVYGEAFRVAMYPFLVVVILHIPNVVYTLIMPILRLYSRTYYAIVFNVSGMLLAIALFVLAPSSIAVTHSFYISLALYHVIVILLMIPTANLIKARQG